MACLLQFPGTLQSQTNTADTKPSLKPWIGVWTFNDQGSAQVLGDPSQKAIVEILPTADGLGLDITRKTSTQPDVKEWLFPDGIKHPVNASNCTGWQSSKLIAEAGMIVSSSEMNCKEAGAYSTSNLKIIVATDRMVDILSLKAGDQTRMAARQLKLERELAAAGSSEANVNMAERMAAAAPWKMDMVVGLSKTIEPQLFEAALVEKNVQLNLNSKTLKELKKAKLPTQMIDILVALAYPEKFRIEKNGKVELNTLVNTSSVSSSTVRNSYSATLPAVSSFNQGLIYDCFYAGYNPYGSGYYPYAGLFTPGSCWNYYSPFWYDRPIYVPVYYTPAVGGSAGSGSGAVPASAGARVDASQGYIQIAPQTNSTHRARPRDSNASGSNATNVYRSSGGSVSASSSGGGSTYSAPSGSSGSSSSSSSSGSSGASASPGGYSSGGSSSGHTAVSR